MEPGGELGGVETRDRGFDLQPAGAPDCCLEGAGAVLRTWLGIIFAWEDHTGTWVAFSLQWDGGGSSGSSGISVSLLTPFSGEVLWLYSLGNGEPLGMLIGWMVCNLGRALWGGCYGVSCVPLNSYVEVETPVPQNATIFGNRVFKEVSEIKWSHWSRLEDEEIRIQTHRGKNMWRYRVKRATYRPRRGAPQNQACCRPGLGLPDWSPPVCGLWLWQPEQRDAEAVVMGQIRQEVELNQGSVPGGEAERGVFFLV